MCIKLPFPQNYERVFVLKHANVHHGTGSTLYEGNIRRTVDDDDDGVDHHDGGLDDDKGGGDGGDDDGDICERCELSPNVRSGRSG